MDRGAYSEIGFLLCHGVFIGSAMTSASPASLPDFVPIEGGSVPLLSLRYDTLPRLSVSMASLVDRTGFAVMSVIAFDQAMQSFHVVREIHIGFHKFTP